MQRDRAYFAGERLTRPLFLGSVALLVLNDHVLKRAWPGVVTGKLSDIAGLCFFPVLLMALLEIATRRKPLGWQWLAGCAFATALVFSLVKTWWFAADAYRHGLGALQWALFNGLRWAGGHESRPLCPVQLARDSTDLVALPMAAVAPWLEHRGRTP